jgi:hypothetical protein
MATVEGGRTLSAREEELLGLLSRFADGDGGSDRELSFSDLVEAAPAPAAARDDHGGTVSPGKPKQDAAAESKQQQQKAVVPERRQRSRSRGRRRRRAAQLLRAGASAHQEQDGAAARARGDAARCRPGRAHESSTSSCCRQGKVSGELTDDHVV